MAHKGFYNIFTPILMSTVLEEEYHLENSIMSN